MLSLTSLSILALPIATLAQYTPLVSLRIPYDQIPYRVDNDPSGRGPQFGYNRCNASTEGPDSLCQTAFFNSLTDFCLWGLPEPNGIVGNDEARSVAWCTEPGHGTRVIPPGAIQGAQFIQTDEYIQVVGQIDQTLINIRAGDAGGEMDSAGEDARGNPLGGLMYSTAFGNGTQQIIRWTNFLGADIFCMKACLPGHPDEARNCEHVYDRVGCYTNIPSNAYSTTEFESCEGDVALPVGVYLDGSGNRRTWYQPQGDIGELPYNPATLIPPSSECTRPSSLPFAFAANQTGVPSASASSSGGASNLASASSIATTSLVPSAGNRAANTDSSSGASTVYLSSSLLALVGLVFFSL